ncbi:cilia- and flagella-associated protein 91-like [Uloborus diversus]|uniref:cilia- and flagella-associated protein 91-like n=1 Tax=Uloborus diversus TaxID=327109 RepID=UPI002408F92E|nr:cilia- and flagella-associated protein 91-like [Uloborus diversus]
MSAFHTQPQHILEVNTSCIKSVNNPCIIQGADLWKFYNKPSENIIKPGDVIFDSEDDVDYCNFSSDEDASPKFVSSGTQTDLRESEAQTDPWDPPYIVHCKHKNQKILQFKNLSYGKGLPASHLEIQHILEKLEICNASTQSDDVINDEDFKKKKKLMKDQIKSEWRYKMSKHNEEQIKKLRVMEAVLAEELKQQTEKQNVMLKSIWAKKQAEVLKKNTKLEKALCKELQSLQPKTSVSKKNESITRTKGIGKRSQRRYHIQKTTVSSEEINKFLESDEITDSQAISSVRNWLEKKKSALKSEIPLAKSLQKSKSEKLSEDVYDSLLEKKRTQLPPRKYHEDYDEEKAPSPPVKSEVEFEILDLPDEGIDLATVWQQVLRGRAYQKQMLELIERHKNALEVRLFDKISEKK